MAAPWIPTFVYGDTPTTLALTFSMRPWRFDTPSEGGHRWSAAGVLATYTVRRQHNLVLGLRVLESERESVSAMLEALADDPALTVTLDTDGVYQTTPVEYECLLVHPQAGEDIDRLFRRVDYLPVFDIEITIRKSDDSAWDVGYFADAEGS